MPIYADWTGLSNETCGMELPRATPTRSCMLHQLVHGWLYSIATGLVLVECSMNSTTQTRFSMASEMWMSNSDMYRVYPSPPQRRAQHSGGSRHNVQSRPGAEAQSKVHSGAQSKSNYSSRNTSDNNNSNYNYSYNYNNGQQQQGRPRRGRRDDQQQQSNGTSVGSVVTSGGTPGGVGTGIGLRQHAASPLIGGNATIPNRASYTAYGAQTHSAGPYSRPARPSASSSSSSSSPISSALTSPSSTTTHSTPPAQSSQSRAAVDSRPSSSSDSASSSASRSYSARSALRHNLSTCPSTPTANSSTPASTMTYSVAVSPRRASLTRPSASVSNKENVCATAAPLQESKESYEVGQPALIQPTPRPVGRARSNSFYGQVQHTVLSRRRSPPPSPLAVVSDSAKGANPASSSKSAHVLTLRQSGLRACAARLDLALGFDSTSSLVTGAVNAALSASSSSVTRVAPSNTCVQITVSTSTSTSDSSTTSVRHCSPVSSLASLSSPFSSAALHTLRTLTPAPLLRPTATTPARDSRSKLVAGLLLNRTKAKPLAAARQRRRALWGCSADSRGEGGVFAGSSLRAEVVF